MKRYIFKPLSEDEIKKDVSGTSINLQSEASLSEYEVDLLKRKNILHLSSIGSQNVVTRCRIDMKELSKVVYEHRILDQVASSLEVKIIRMFDESSKGVYTTKQIANRVKSPGSSVSRALKNLCKKNLLKQLQKGVYTIDLAWEP